MLVVLQVENKRYWWLRPDIFNFGDTERVIISSFCLSTLKKYLLYYGTCNFKRYCNVAKRKVGTTLRLLLFWSSTVSKIKNKRKHTKTHRHTGTQTHKHFCGNQKYFLVTGNASIKPFTNGRGLWKKKT